MTISDLACGIFLSTNNRQSSPAGPAQAKGSCPRNLSLLPTPKKTRIPIDKRQAMVWRPNLSVSAPVITPRRRAAQAQDSMRRDVVPRCSEAHPNQGPLIRCARVLEYQGVSLVLWKSSLFGVLGGGASPVINGPTQVLFGSYSPGMLISNTLLEP